VSKIIPVESRGTIQWKCTGCNGLGVCYCDSDFMEPICDCGELSWCCRCDEIEEEEKGRFRQEAHQRAEELKELLDLARKMADTSDINSDQKRLAELILKVMGK
jgi:hypothetical protein